MVLQSRFFLYHGVASQIDTEYKTLNPTKFFEKSQAS